MDALLAGSNAQFRAVVFDAADANVDGVGDAAVDLSALPSSSPIGHLTGLAVAVNSHGEVLTQRGFLFIPASTGCLSFILAFWFFRISLASRFFAV